MNLTKDDLQHITKQSIDRKLADEIEEVEYALNLTARSGKFSKEFNQLTQEIVEKLKDNGFDATYSNVGYNEYAWTISWK